MADLRSCPFCGGEVKIIPEQVDARTVIYNFVCQNGDCGANVYFDYSDKEESIESFNTRKPMEAVVVELENASYRTESTFDEDGYCNDDSEEVIELQKAISIVRGKE